MSKAVGRRSGSKREALVEAAREVVARDGLAGASVRAVAAEASVSVGTVLYHFEGGIEELQRLALARVMDALYLRRLRVVAGAGDMASKLANLVELGVPDEIDADLASIYSSIAQVRADPLLAAAHRELVDRQVSLYLSLLQVGVEDGVIGDGVPVQDVARNIVALEDAYDLYPLLGLDCGGGSERRRRVRGYIELALGLVLPAA